MASLDPISIVAQGRIGTAEAGEIGRLLDTVAIVEGAVTYNRDAWRDLTEAGRDGVVALVARHPLDHQVVGYAQLAPDRSGCALDCVVGPLGRLEGLGADLTRAALDHVASTGGGEVHRWLERASRADERDAAAAGLHPTRSLYQLRRPLPVEGDPGDGSRALPTRPFRPGEDETAWLEVNNRAFVRHPEQGGWDLATIARREAEPWFDPDGFLLHEIDGRLAGFCWTKVHDDEDPVYGEIYVIAVDPDFENQGLGRSLVLAGLDHLAARRITVGMLYVDAGNVGAVKLYADLGFEVHHVNRLYAAAIGGRP